MPLDRRTLLLAAGSAGLLGAAAAPVVRVGVLRFGTVSWEIDVIRRHGFDAAAGVQVEPLVLAGSQATQVALQAGRVEISVQDWLWVSRQRSSGADWTCAPFSNAIGAVIAPPASPVRTLADLRGRRLGIAGGPLDKSWLILRAFALRQAGLDLNAKTERSFAAPPLLAHELAAGRLDAALTYWPFVARAEAAGLRVVLSIEDALRGLGIGADVPITGYVFSAAWAARAPGAIAGFLAAAERARALLATSDAEWQSLLPLTGAADQAELLRLRDAYRAGIPGPLTASARAAAARLFDVLAATGGAALVGDAHHIAPGTFWPAAPT